MARLATPDLVVSMEMGIDTYLAMVSITGTTRRVSSSSDTASEKGRVDSPPTSRMSAPSATSFSA